MRDIFDYADGIGSEAQQLARIADQTYRQAAAGCPLCQQTCREGAARLVEDVFDVDELIAVTDAITKSWLAVIPLDQTEARDGCLDFNEKIRALLKRTARGDFFFHLAAESLARVILNFLAVPRMLAVAKLAYELVQDRARLETLAN